MSPYLTLIFLWLTHFLVDFMLGIWSVYKTMSALDLGVAGLIASLCAFTGEGMQLFFGPMTDRGHGKRLIFLGVLLTGANVLLAYTGSYQGLFLLFLATCIGSGAFHPAAVALTGNLTGRQKGLFISIFASGGALGMAVSQLTFAKVYMQFDGHTVLLLVPTILMLLCLIGYGFLLKEAPLQKERSPINFKMFKDYFKNRSLRTLYFMQVCNQTIFWGMIFLLPDVLVVRGYDESLAYGGGHMAFIIGSAFIMIPSGYFADRFSPRIVILISSILGMVLYFAFLLFPDLSSFNVLLLLLGAGSFLGIVQPVAVALGNDLGRKNPGLVSAFTMGMVWCVSETLGPAGTGLLSKLFQEDAPAKALMIYGLFFPLLIWSAYKLPQTQPVPLNQEISEN